MGQTVRVRAVGTYGAPPAGDVCTALVGLAGKRPARVGQVIQDPSFVWGDGLVRKGQKGITCLNATHVFYSVPTLVT